MKKCVGLRLALVLAVLGCGNAALCCRVVGFTKKLLARVSAKCKDPTRLLDPPSWQQAPHFIPFSLFSPSYCVSDVSVLLIQHSAEASDCHSLPLANVPGGDEVHQTSSMKEMTGEGHDSPIAKPECRALALKYTKQQP